MVKETYNWFAHSSVRQFKYKLLYETINNGQEPHKITQACQTRWLSIESAVSRIIEQWTELKTFFEVVRLSERCYTAETLYSMYNDGKNFAVMSFLRGVLIEVQKVNKLFESNNADQTKLFVELSNLLNSLISKIILPHKKCDLFETKIEDYIDKNCYLGYSFESSINNLLQTKMVSVEEVQSIRERLIHFIKELIKEIRQRLPKSFETLQQVSLLSADNALKHNKLTLVPLLKYFNKSDLQIDDIERQWHNIHLLKWTETNNTKSFWCEVVSFRNASGDNPFLELANFALEMLILPYSNADVERLFSKLNIIKNKLRNRLKPTTVNAILHIKCGLNRYGKCCHNYDMPHTVLDKIKTKETYAFSLISQSSEESEERDYFEIIDIVTDL